MSESRKEDHINLAFESIPKKLENNYSLNYEPMLSAHPKEGDLKTKFLGFDLDMPLWISSMTGGTQKAKNININLAKACAEFKIGMGLGSCRPLLESNARLADFDIKELMPNAPLFTNFGIAQLEQLIENKNINKVYEVTKNLQADGIIIHVNPLQEWAQPEGDRFKKAPIETIKYLCQDTDIPLIVKEVGQGMGPRSLSELCKLPISCIELAGYGGTNFTNLELSRRNDVISGKRTFQKNFGLVGHTPEEMLGWLNEIKSNKEIIISGGITDPIRGYSLMQRYLGNSIIGMASEVLKHGMGDYSELQSYLYDLKDSLCIAKRFLKG